MSVEAKDQDDDFMTLDVLAGLGQLEDKNKGGKLKLDLEPEEEEDDKDEEKESDEEEDDKPEPKPLDLKTEEVEEDLTKESDDLKSTLATIFGKGAFGILEIENENGEVEEIDFKDAVVDYQTFTALAANKIKEIEEEAKKDKVSTESLSEFLLNMIEIEKNGGQTQELFNYREAYIKPLDAMDLDTLTDQRKIAVMGLRMENKPDEDIEIMIAGWEARGILESKAKDYDVRIRGAVEHKVQAERDAVLKMKADEEVRLVAFKKEVKSNLTQFELNDKAKERLVNLATKPDERGRFDIDKLYDQKKADPKQASRLALFLSDEEEFIKQVTRDVVREKQLEIGKRIKISLSSGVPNVKSKSKSREDDDYIELPKLK